jgi:protein-L-isoaspartate(D-aspartate) O-methyltransferase
MERIPALYEQARQAILRAGVNNVSMSMGDGSVGWREYAPYDAILVSAGAPAVPEPLVSQLADGGTLLVPIGTRENQRLVLVRKKGSEIQTREMDPVRFVPLVGHHGWNKEP